MAQNVRRPDLAVPGPLGDVWLGPADAKVTIIEYASMTCSHCAAFHQDTYPELKKRYIDTGKVRFILREFPLDPLATAGFMLARCDGDDKYYPIIDLLFDTAAQLGLHRQAPRRPAADACARPVFHRRSSSACLKDQKLYDAVNAVRNRARRTIQGRLDADLLHQRPARTREACRSMRWRRSSSRCWGRSARLLSPRAGRGRRLDRGRVRARCAQPRALAAARSCKLPAARGDARMKLTRLRVVGFKTFVEPTEFLIEPGLTGVVGPNGCGKSNLVEALRWVMGESSHKNMRAVRHGRRHLLRLRRPPGAQHRRSRRSPSTTPTARAPAAFNDADQLDVSRRIERERGLDLPRQRPRGPRPRRAAAVRRRRHGRALAVPRAPGPDQRDHLGQAPGAPAHPGGRRRHRRPPRPPPRGGAAAEGGRGQPRARRGRAARDRGADREPEAAEPPGRRATRRRRPKSAGSRRVLHAIGYARGARRRPPPPSGRPRPTSRPWPTAQSAQTEAATAQAVAAHALPGLREAEAAAAAALQRPDPRPQRTRGRGAPRQASAAPNSTRHLAELDSDVEPRGRLARATPRPRSTGSASRTRTSPAPTDGADARARRERGAAESRRGRPGRRRGGARRARRRRPPTSTPAAPRWSGRRGRSASAPPALAAEKARVARDLAALARRRGRKPPPSRRFGREAAAAAEAARLAEDEAAAGARRARRGPRGRGPRRGAAQRGRAQGAAAGDGGAHAGQALRPGRRGDLWPRALDRITVAKGYETALGAALGDDLDASTDASAPAHWADTGAGDADPPCPPASPPLADVASGAAGARSAACARSASSSGRTGDALRGRSGARPAARLARGRSLALGRVRRRRRSAVRGGAAARGRRTASATSSARPRRRAQAADGCARKPTPRRPRRAPPRRPKRRRSTPRGADAPRPRRRARRLAAAERREAERATRKRSALAARRSSRLDGRRGRGAARGAGEAEARWTISRPAPTLEAGCSKRRAGVAERRAAPPRRARRCRRSVARGRDARGAPRERSPPRRGAGASAPPARQSRRRPRPRAGRARRPSARPSPTRRTASAAPPRADRPRSRPPRPKRARGRRRAGRGRDRARRSRPRPPARRSKPLSRGARGAGRPRRRAPRRPAQRLAEIARAHRRELGCDAGRPGRARRPEAGAPLPADADGRAQLENLRGERERLGAVNLRAEEELAEARGQARQASSPSATI